MGCVSTVGAGVGGAPAGAADGAATGATLMTTLLAVAAEKPYALSAVVTAPLATTACSCVITAAAAAPAVPLAGVMYVMTYAALTPVCVCRTRSLRVHANIGDDHVKRRDDDDVGTAVTVGIVTLPPLVYRPSPYASAFEIAV